MLLMLVTSLLIFGTIFVILNFAFIKIFCVGAKYSIFLASKVES